MSILALRTGRLDMVYERFRQASQYLLLYDDRA